MHPQYEETTRQVIAWARESNGIQGIILIGSQARTAQPADRWSDLDLMVLVDDPQALMEDLTWFRRFGALACFFEETVPLHFTNWSWRVRRVLYCNHQDVDFSVLPDPQLDEVLAVNRDILSKGCQVLYDAAPGRLEAKLSALLDGSKASPPVAPTPEKLQAVVSELLYHVIWAYKKIRRQELWVAMSCINCHMKELLLWLVEAHTTSLYQRANPLAYSGRFIEQRLDPTVRGLLAGCFTRYDPQEAVAALQNIFDLTRRLSGDICRQQGYPIDTAQFEHVQVMFDEMRKI